LGATAPSWKRNDGSSVPASGAGVGPNGGWPCPKVSVPVAAATMPPVAAAPSMSRRENPVIRNLLIQRAPRPTALTGVTACDRESTKLGTRLPLAYA